mmetsp:Transcript_17042/g.24107  ORF Transcript_17042/g.24107 Transcript_17042/m.24107 type:complete len:80 (-) Transcript_17042:534-773(-)
MVFQRLLNKVPGGSKAKVFVGSAMMVGACAIPVFAKNEKRGHDLFSQERPEAIIESQEKAMKDYDKKEREKRQHNLTTK